MTFIVGVIRYIIFWLSCCPFVVIALFSPSGTAFGPKFLRVFMRWQIWLAGIRVRVHGELSKERPLLLVGNHISIIEMAIYPVAFGNSFFGKKELEKLPVVGWMMKKFGVVFVDRRSAQAISALNAVKKQMALATWPMAIFPEGTTTNGAYVKPFKSTLFNFMETKDGIGGAAVQPVVMVYRYADGSKISDEDLAEHYAYFDNIKQDRGPYCSIERSIFGQFFHIVTRGGMLVELYVQPPLPLSDIKDRKELALILQKKISEEYEKLK